MPSVQLLVDKSLGLDAAKLGQLAHEAVKTGIGKPEQYITVAVTMADCVLVGGKAQSVLAQVDSIGGNFAGFVTALCSNLWKCDTARVCCDERCASWMRHRFSHGLDRLPTNRRGGCARGVWYRVFSRSSLRDAARPIVQKRVSCGRV
eukprot:1851101-Prymnesium_polylepis.1